ncbi:O-acetyl-ADP-ribose deacetylase [Stappia sp. GBMRC 2046]|uniref:O-acetyl-ADP-ribose deacetylase n=1 Tax=Stappia sediminis TaxID=2692190 RepID=A0A7X3LTS0_9HYPH|nr:O-acetyl-ADP-ribose deacetylase [Stappia sediminis]MXN64942.1 O-acetyl-ADP-ribose deacetylase [Stappia sediminis]
MRDRLSVVVGDITKLEVDAIVNAANEQLLRGGGVDGAIHRAAGPELQEECRKIGGCPTGEARLTKGYRLPARHVIHTVGPVWRGGNAGEPDFLAACYRNSISIANAQGFASIAFPAISTGIYGYPADEAAAIAVKTTMDALLELGGDPEKVIFCCFSEEGAAHHRAALDSILQ